MKYTTLFAFFFLISVATCMAGGKYLIKPKGYQEPVQTEISSTKAKNRMSAIDKVGGHFRLLEFSETAQKQIETEVVSFFLGKNNEQTVTFSVNCAKKMMLRFEFNDSKKSHTVKVTEPADYYRFRKEVDLSDLNSGIITMKVYNEKNEMIYSTEFEKVSI